MCSLLQLLRAAEQTLQLVETNRYELEALLLPSEVSVTISDICHDADSGELLLADTANRCVKAIAASSRVTLVFKCDSIPRALRLVRSKAGAAASMLLVELVKTKQQVVRFELVVAARSGQRFNGTQRLLLSALSKDAYFKNGLTSVNMATTSGGFVLIGNIGAKALEVLKARNSNNKKKLAAPIPLDFVLWQFSVGIAEERELLVATERSTRTVHLLKVEISTGVPALSLFARLTSAESSQLPNRVLQFGRHVLLGSRHASSESHAVECLPISGPPLRQSQVLRVDRQVNINCWRASVERVLLFDMNHKQLLSLECAFFERFLVPARFAEVLRLLAARAVATIGAWGGQGPPTNRFGPPTNDLGYCTVQFKSYS